MAAVEIVATDHERVVSWVTSAHERYFDRLVGLGRMLTNDAAAAEDLAQEIFVSAFRALQERPDFRIRDPWAWLSHSMRYAAANFRRGRRRRTAREAFVAPWFAVSPDEGSVDVDRAIRRLPPRMRACAQLVYLRGLTHQQAATILGCGPRTVETHLRRARGRLRRSLAVQEFDGGGREEMAQAAVA